MHVSILIQGHLDPVWQEWLGGLHIEHETHGTSRLYGELQDQPALHGILVKLHRLNVPLLSLETSQIPYCEDDHAAKRQEQGT